jgi:hypothetical protein
MEINNMQGAKAYANPPGTTPPVDNVQVQNQKLEATKTDINSENVITANKAFEVSITPEARDTLAAQTSKEPAETQTKIPEDQAAKNIKLTHEKSQIVNIVA